MEEKTMSHRYGAAASPLVAARWRMPREAHRSFTLEAAGGSRPAHTPSNANALMPWEAAREARSFFDTR